MSIAHFLTTVNDYQKETHRINHQDLRPEVRMHYVRQYSLALVVEQVELLQVLPWKPWKYNACNPGQYDKKEATKEWCDCLIFLLDQALALDLNAEEIDETFYEIIKHKTVIQKT